VTGAPGLPVEATLVAMATLPQVGPARLAALGALGPPPATWATLVRAATDATAVDDLTRQLGEVTSGRGGGSSLRDLVRRWATAAAGIDVVGLWDAHRAAGVTVWRRGCPPYPDEAFTSEALPPEVLLTLGDPRALDGARVAIVGTRSCTRYGLDVAAELARELGAAGVAVVSGLAAGIDAAAHRAVVGVDTAPAIAVVASGPDVIYPRANASLWRRVVATGLLVTEAPLGTRPEAWRFPQRNRIIAALGDVVVVVESHRRGGAAITARHAMDQGRTVLVVPGPIRSPASAGCHDLIADGAGVCRGIEDVLVALGMTPGVRRARSDPRPAPSGDAAVVLAALGWSPATLDQLTATSGLRVAEVVAALDVLAEHGWVAERGGWFEQVAVSALRG